MYHRSVDPPLIFPRILQNMRKAKCYLEQQIDKLDTRSVSLKKHLKKYHGFCCRMLAFGIL